MALQIVRLVAGHSIVQSNREGKGDPKVDDLDTVGQDRHAVTYKQEEAQRLRLASQQDTSRG